MRKKLKMSKYKLKNQKKKTILKKYKKEKELVMIEKEVVRNG